MAHITTDAVLAALDKHANPSDATFLQGFFKTGEGQYGAGDVFIGVRVPQVRSVAKQFRGVGLAEIEELLESPIHEVRLCAVVIMAEQAKRADDAHRKALYDLYLRRSDRVNNWDLVDLSCREVVGGYLYQHPEEQAKLKKLARSSLVWDRRIAIISTWQFIRHGELDQAFEIAEILLHDKHDLIHKAVGWMLRTAGDKDGARLRSFLAGHIRVIPRTALRYAIEHFDPRERQYFLKLR
ncbi:MAG TPA: DNA alkylation repair protein [Candidatus Saccharimonadales bacterium]|nr:DNA alkylation repair protein [Candidatus Saccharimonadales bacterium]